MDGILQYQLCRKVSEIQVLVSIILTALVFTFLHSEIGMFEFDSCDHSAHDYCEIIKNTNIRSKTMRNELLRHQHSQEIGLISLKGFVIQFKIIYSGRIVVQPGVKRSAEIFEINKTFLI